MNLSAAGLDAIASHEGFRERAYPDPGSANGLPVTIGFGSTRWEDGSPIQLGQTVSRERAKHMMARELEAIEQTVGELVKVPLTQGQFDALCSFVYNVGAGAFKASTLLRLLNAGNTAGAADEFLRWNKNDGSVMPGLTKRREAERALFLSRADKPVSELGTPNTMSPFIIPALDMLVRAVPTIADLFKGETPSKVAERNIEAVKVIADKVIPIVLQASGQTNVQAAAEAAVADPKVAADMDAAARREYFELQRVSVKEARDFAVQYAQTKDVRTVVGRFTFLEFFTLFIVAMAAVFLGWLLHLGLLEGALLGSVVTLVVIAGFVEPRKFWLGLPAGEPPEDGPKRGQ